MKTDNLKEAVVSALIATRTVVVFLGCTYVALRADATYALALVFGVVAWGASMLMLPAVRHLK